MATTLVLPSSAFALRGIQSQEAGLEELRQELQAEGTSPILHHPSPVPLQYAAGMEESLDDRAEKLQKRVEGGGQDVLFTEVDAFLQEYYTEIMSPVGEADFKLFLRAARQAYPDSGPNLWEAVFPVLKEAESMTNADSVGTLFRVSSRPLRKRQLSPEHFLPAEPEVGKKNPYARRLEILLRGPHVTRGSIERYAVLKKIGPEVEKYARILLRNRKVKVAIFPVGSTLKRYASLLKSDVELAIHLLDDGNPDPYTIKSDIESEILTGVKDLLAKEGFEPDDVGIGGFKKAVNVLNLAHGNRSFGVSPVDAELLASLFLPIAYGDAGLVETARRNATLFLRSQDRNRWVENWESIRQKYGELIGIEVDQERIAGKSHLRRWLLMQGIDPDALQAVAAFNQRRYKRLGLPSFQNMLRIYSAPNSSATPAGLEEMQTVFNQLLESEKVKAVLQEKNWFRVDAEQAQVLGFKAIGGFVIAGSAKVTDSGHMIIADSDLENSVAQKALPWIDGGKTAFEVVRNAVLLRARRGDLPVLEAEPGLTEEKVNALLAEMGLVGSEAPRVVIGDKGKVAALPVIAFQLFASEDGLPPVIVLSVAVQLQDKAGNTYTLILMA